MNNRENPPKNLAELVRAERKSHKLHQQELATMSDVGINLVSQLEGGRCSVRLDKLLQVLNQLGIQLIAKCGDTSVVITNKDNSEA